MTGFLSWNHRRPARHAAKDGRATMDGSRPVWIGAALKLKYGSGNTALGARLWERGHPGRVASGTPTLPEQPAAIALVGQEPRNIRDLTSGKARRFSSNKRVKAGLRPSLSPT